MKKYLAASLILHSCLFLTAMIKNEPTIPEKFEITMQEASGGKGQNPDKQEHVVEINDAGIGNESLPEHFYWGLGFNSTEYISYIDHIEYLVVEVDIVYESYCAKAAGLRSGDKIILVNNAKISSHNDIRGDGPTEISLTILRGDVKIEIHTNRCKVYY